MRRLHSPIGEHVLKDTSVGAVVIDHQHGDAGQTFGSDPRVRRRTFGDAKTDGEMELAPLADLAFDPKRPAHEFDQLHRDGQSQAGAAVATRGRCVGLAERFKNLLLFFAGDSDRRCH